MSMVRAYRTVPRPWVVSVPHDILARSLLEIRYAMASGHTPPELVTDAAVREVLEHNPRLRAFISLNEAAARAQAGKAAMDIARGAAARLLHAVPVAVKDVFASAGTSMTLGSLAYHHRPMTDAKVVQDLRTAGAVIMGSTNLHELALGPTGDVSDGGATVNPIAPERVPGGSSSGSAAAVSAHLVFAALGTDTGGSVRIPAACFGVVGMKPTFGMLSTTGVFPLAPSLDHVGLLTRSVAENRYLFGVLGGADADVLVHRSRVRPTHRLNERHRRRVALLDGYFQSTAQDDVLQALEHARRALEHAGVTVQGQELDGVVDGVAAGRTILASEAAAVHRRRLAPEKRMALGQEVAARLAHGAAISRSTYFSAREQAAKMRAAVLAALNDVDVLICPTLPVMPPRVMEREVTVGGTTLQVFDVLTRFTMPFNVAGVPAVSVPAGIGADGLPIGVQVIGRHHDEATVYDYASLLEQSGAV